MTSLDREPVNPAVAAWDALMLATMRDAHPATVNAQVTAAVAETHATYADRYRQLQEEIARDYRERSAERCGSLREAVNHLTTGINRLDLDIAELRAIADELDRARENAANYYSNGLMAIANARRAIDQMRALAESSATPRAQLVFAATALEGVVLDKLGPAMCSQCDGSGMVEGGAPDELVRCQCTRPPDPLAEAIPVARHLAAHLAELEQYPTIRALRDALDTFLYPYNRQRPADWLDRMPL